MERDQAIDDLYPGIEYLADRQLMLGDHAVNIANRVIYLAGSVHL